MNVASMEYDAHFLQLQATLRAPQEPSAEVIDAAIKFAREAVQAEIAGAAISVLKLLVDRAPSQARLWQLLGFAYAEEQRIPEAHHAFEEATRLDPQQPLSAFAYAQASLDAGYPAPHLFQRAHELAPGNLAALGGCAASLAAQGERAAAEALLANALQQFPDWLAGQKSLAALRFTGTGTLDFARSYGSACALQPQNLPLRMAWFAALAQAREWEKALQVIADGQELFGTLPAFAAAQAVVAGETGDLGHANTLFSLTEGQQDATLRIAHVRHCLRTQQIEKAERLALESLQGPSADGFWPYLSLIWRLRGDTRAQWLDGSPPYIRTFDLGFSAGELDALAGVLRRLHTARGPFAEQSVRGGTQTDTDRQLFFRGEPEIQLVRAKVCEAIREYLAGLPGPLSGHPLLGQPRGRILFSGSWSVRLTAQGSTSVTPTPWDGSVRRSMSRCRAVPALILPAGSASAPRRRAWGSTCPLMCVSSPSPDA